MGLIYIAFSVICSLAIAHFLKVTEQSENRVLNVLCINYVTAAAISFFISEDKFISKNDFPVPLLILAGLLGVIFIANLFIYSASINKIGMGISIAAMRMSLVIPIGVSLVIYGEAISIIKYSGIILVFMSMYLLLPKLKLKESKISIGLFFPVLLFLMTGIADTSLKVYEREFSGILSEYSFLSLIFSFAFLAGIGILVYKKDVNFSGREILYGIIIGVANLYSSFFLILALQEMKGAITFSITNIANIVLGALIGIVLWKDHVSRKQKAGLVLALISILMLV